MRTILLFSLLLLLSCKGQEKENVGFIKTKKTMKYFDIERFNTNQNYGEYIYTDSLGNIIREWGNGSEDIYYGRYVHSRKDPNIETIYHFYKNGGLKEEGQIFNESFRIGVWKFYDESGILTKEINYDKSFEKYPLDKVLKYMKSREADLSGMYTRIYRDINGVPMWYLTWDANQRTKEDCLTMINIEIDVEQGEIVKEYHTFFWEYHNPYDEIPKPIIIFDKTTSNPSTPPYRTHNGKSYTEEEWKSYEEAQYQEYLKKKNGKGFWDKLFGD